MTGFGDGNSRPVVPAGQASRDTGVSHPTVVNIELRQAWDGAWYPLIGEQDEPSYASYYGDSAMECWENANLSTRKSVIISLESGTSERTWPPTWQLTNLSAAVSVAQMYTEPDRQAAAVPTFETTIANDRVGASALYGSAALCVNASCRIIRAPGSLLPAERSIRLPPSDVFASGASNVAAVNKYHGERPPAALSQIIESECEGSPFSSDDHGAPRDTCPHPQSLPPVTDAALLKASQPLPLPSIPTSTLQVSAAPKDDSPKATPQFKLPPPVAVIDAKYPPKAPPICLRELDSTEPKASPPTFPKNPPTPPPPKCWERYISIIATSG